MNSTPRPLSTAAAAVEIWSGVGEVNTCPGQAASSIPQPTNPACSGSWPLPPPESSATLPLASGARATKAGFSCSERISRWARARPRNASGTTFTASLMNFFIGSSFAPASFDQLGDALDELPDQVFQRALLPLIAKDRHLQREDLAPRMQSIVVGIRVRGACRVGGGVCLEEALPLLRGEVTDLEDGRQVPRRNGHGVDGIGELRDEALVLAERDRDPRAHAGRAAIDVVLENRLVGRDWPRLGRLDAARCGPSGHDRRPHA